MSKIILTSTNSELRSIFNGQSFIDANYDTHYDNKKFEHVLHLKHEPVVGDYLYFYGNYYEQIPVKVSRISYNTSGEMMVWCDNARLMDIDPYLYNDDPSQIGREVRQDIINAYNKMKDKIQKDYQKNLEEYPNSSELRFIAHFIDSYLGLSENTIIDHINVWYLIKNVISSEFGFEWHRPYKWEYVDM